MACISLFMLVFVVVTSFAVMVEAVPSPQSAENGNGRCPIGDCYFGVPCPFGTTPTYKFCNMAFGSKCCESPRGTSNMCEKAGGKCISRKKRCNGNVDKRIKCDKKREVCCISDNLTTQLSTDISDNHTTSSPMVDINDGLAPGSKCGMPQPKMGWSGGPVFVRHVSKATQELFDALRQQVQEKIHHGKPFEEFIVDCYLKQLVAVTSYKAQVNVNGNHCIRIHAFQPLGPPDEPLIFKSVQDNMPCEEKQDQVVINITDVSTTSSNVGPFQTDNGTSHGSELGQYVGQCGNPDIWPCNTGKTYGPVAPGVCPHNLKPLPTCFCTFGPCICCELPQQ